MKIKLHYQTYKVITIDGEKTVEVAGTEAAARRAVKRAGDMLIKSHEGERTVTCDVPVEVIAKYEIIAKHTEKEG